MYENLPPELKTEKAWVNVWNGSKVPMQSSIRKAASSVLPETWSDFDTAAAAANKNIRRFILRVFLFGTVCNIGTARRRQRIFFTQRNMR